VHRLFLLGLNHASAPLEVREKLAFNAAGSTAALDALRQEFPACEGVLLCTCNRTEIYIARAEKDRPGKEELIEFLARQRGLSADAFASHLYLKAEREAVSHLFSVTSSLDSMVLGETQILGQVRQAYESARAQGTAGPMLHPLFQRALSVAKKVMSETKLAEGRVSVASVAVEYAKQIFDKFSDKTVLSIGAGKMSAIVLEHLKALGSKRLVICNRDLEKAKALAARFGSEAVGIDGLADHLAKADIVVTATGSTQPIITRAMFEKVMRRRKRRPVFIIDIAMPRDVAADVGELDNVYLYNLDDLQQVVMATRDQRGGAVEAANLIIAEQVGEFIVWHRMREAGPIIDQLFRRAHAMAQEELERTLWKLGSTTDAQRQQLEDLTRRIVNKLLHDPVSVLRDPEAAHGSGGQYRHAVTKLFKLDDEADGSTDA